MQWPAYYAHTLPFHTVWITTVGHRLKSDQHAYNGPSHHDNFKTAELLHTEYTCMTL